MNKKAFARYCILSAVVLCAAAVIVGITAAVSAMMSRSAVEGANSRGAEIAAQLEENISDIGVHNSRVADNAFNINKESVRLYISADNDEATIRNTLAEIQRLSDEICAGIDSEYDRLYAISAWVAENIYYDYDAKEISATAETYTLVKTLETRRTICFGYANLVAALCQAQGIDCRVAHGTASFQLFREGTATEPHEWNVAVIDGRHIWLDSLWDTTNSYRGGIYIDGEQDSDDFDIPDSELCRTRRADRIDIRDYFSCLD